MIDRAKVTAELLVVLRATWGYIGDGYAPTGVPDGSPYGILEAVPGGMADGSVGAPESDATLRYRVRAVGRDLTGGLNEGVARQQAELLADKLRSRMLNRSAAIAGTGWRVSQRTHESYNGADTEGRSVNVSDDYLLWVVAT